MKRFLIAILLALACCIHAQHRMGVSLAPAMSLQFDNLSNSHSLPGVGGALGVTYQYKYRLLLAQTGVELSYTTMRQRIDDSLIGENQLCRDCLDAMRMMGLAVPIMAGVHVNTFYALAGAKVVLYPNITTLQRATIAIREEDRYYDDMNEVFLDDHNIQSQGKMNTMPDLHACVEVGTRLPLNKRRYQKSPILQLGLFAEYNIFNTHLEDYSIVTNDGNATAEIDLDHIYAPYVGTEQNLKINHLYIGIRATVLFDISRPKCRYCED